MKILFGTFQSTVLKSPCLKLSVVGETRQGEEQTQFAVVVFRRTELLEGMETLDRLLHCELQLKHTSIILSQSQMTE